LPLSQEVKGDQMSKVITINHPLLRIDFMDELEKEPASEIEKARDMLLCLLKND
jgi:hypothetical protein